MLHSQPKKNQIKYNEVRKLTFPNRMTFHRKGRAITQGLDTGFSLRRTGFAARSVHIGFVVEEVTLEQIFLRIPRFYPVIIVPLMLFLHSCIIWGINKGPVRGSFPQKQSHTIATETTSPYKYISTLTSFLSLRLGIG